MQRSFTSNMLLCNGSQDLATSGHMDLSHLNPAVESREEPIRRTSSLFSFSLFSNKKAQNTPVTHTKQNLKFLQTFKVIFDEISTDLVARVEELQEVIDILNISDKFNADTPCQD